MTERIYKLILSTNSGSHIPKIIKNNAKLVELAENYASYKEKQEEKQKINFEINNLNKVYIFIKEDTKI